MKNIMYWKTLTANMLFAYQALFLGSTVWDFFMTVIMPASLRSHIFSILPTGLSIFIVIPWLIGIFILSGILFAFIINKEHRPVTTRKINIEYGGMMIIYIVLFFLASFNPVITWPLMLNYAMNVVWAWSLICFRIAVQRGLEDKADVV